MGYGVRNALMEVTRPLTHVNNPALQIFSIATVVNAYLCYTNVTDQMSVMMGVMNRQMPVETTAGVELTSHALTENASLPLGNVIHGRIAMMEVMKHQLSVQFYWTGKNEVVK